MYLSGRKIIWISFYVNTESLQNSIKLRDFIKEINHNSKIISYGEMLIYLLKFCRNTKFDAIVDICCDHASSLLDFFNYYINKISEEEQWGVILIKDKRLIYKIKEIFLDSKDWDFTNNNKVCCDVCATLKYNGKDLVFNGE